MQQEVTKVCVTGGAGQVGYSLCFMIGAGRLLGPDRKIHLTIIEVPHANNVAEGLIMELKDCAFPALAHVEFTTDAEAGFKGCDIALLVGARPRGPGMTRADLLKVNASIFKVQAQAIEKNANKDCKILVVGNPANTNAAIIAHYAPSLSKKNITSLTRLDMNRAKSLLAEKTGLPSDSIHNVIIWGNHSNTQFPHIGDAYANTEHGTQKVASLVNDDDWVQKEFISQV